MDFVRRKVYQYEVTFGLYMLEPWEKLIFNSIVCLLLSVFVLSVWSYFPSHVRFVAQKAAYYYHGTGEELAFHRGHMSSEL